MAAHGCLCELFLFCLSWLVENESCWVAKGDLDLPASTSQVLGLQICASHPARAALANHCCQVESFFMSAAKDEDPPLHKGIVCRSTLFLTVCRGCGIVHTLVCGLLPGMGSEEGPSLGSKPVEV